MASASELLNLLRGRLLAGDQKAIAAINASFRVVLTGEGASTWLINLRTPVGVVEAETDTTEGECMIKVSASDFASLLEGRANGQQLFFEGKLLIEGEMRHALHLQKLAELLR